MKYRENIILLPCHSLEDFPLHHEGDDAQGLLANWTALWHPALIHCVESIPAWHRVDDPPEDLSERLVLAPSVSVHELPTGFAQRAKEEGANFIRKKTDRDEIISLALENLDGGDGQVDGELAADFLALGYCYLQVELLTRQMRYSSNLDEIHFSNQTVAAAKAAMERDVELAREKLTSCFDVLAEERDHYYPVDAFIIDLTLVADTTIGQVLRDELALSSPINLLLSATSVECMAQQESETLAALRAKLEKGEACVLGGESVERRLPLLSCETILSEFRSGLEDYKTHLGEPPKVFGRRRFGLTPALPQILSKLGIEAGLHATLDDGRFPEGVQIKTRWESPDGTSIDAMARAPLDATKPATYLNLAVKMGESMDMDHVATVCLAHWPGKSSVWLSDLRRIASYGPALGKFVTFDEYIRETDDAGQSDRFTADQYQSPYLKQAIIRRTPNPISSSTNYWRQRTAAEAANALRTLVGLVTGDVAKSSDTLLNDIDRTVEIEQGSDLNEQTTNAVADATKRFAECLPRQDREEVEGYLVANPCSFVRRIGVETPELKRLPVVEKPIYSASDAGDTKQIIVDVPPMGFVWVAPGKKPAGRSRRDNRPLAEDKTQDEGYCLLRNEFFEVLIDSTTGAMRSLYEYKHRGNRLSQQLAFRLPGQRANVDDTWQDPDEMANYSVMAADNIEVTSNSSTLGEIVVNGRLLDKDGTDLAEYQQTFRLWRGTRVVLIDIELDPKVDPRADPWNSYFAARFAWAEPTVDMWRAVNGLKQAISSKHFEAPQYIDIESIDKKRKTTILTGGLPFHRKCGHRILDSLLIVRGETARRFRVGIGIDVPYPMQAATSLLMPDTLFAQTAAVPSPASSSWLFHVDAKNIVATHWEPMESDGSVQGFRVRLLETAARSCRATLSSFHAIREARVVDFQGNSISDCKIEEGKVRLDVCASEWAEIECRW